VSSTPQFGTAEYSSPSAGETCKACHQPIAGVFYRANTASVCGSCADHLQRQIPQDSHAAFVRGILFGLAGCVLGLILYAGFTILTGIEIGFVSLAVGWLVGKAIMMGSRGVGGRRYQIAAVLLTYAAVSMAFVPILLHYMRAHPEAYSAKQRQAAPSASRPADAASSEPQTQVPSADATSHDPSKSDPASPTSAAPKPAMGFLGAVARLAGLGLISPFLQLSSGASGLIGLFILFIGMQFAWKITRGVRLAISGPYPTSSGVKA